MSSIRTALERAKKQRAEILDSTGSRAAALNQVPAPDDTARTPVGGRYLRMNDLPRCAVDYDALRASRILIEDKQNPAESAYRMVRTRVMRKMRSNGWRVLGVSSLGPGEGKTFTAVNLAISIAAEMGQEALLVDLDLRRPSVYRYLGVDAADFTSLSQYLDGTAPDLETLFVCPSVDRLGCLLTSIPMEQPSDVLGSPRGRELFDELRRALPPETMVVVDLPPLLAVDDALAVAPMLDGLLFVIAEGHTKRDDVLEAREILQEFNVVGTVLNKSVEREKRSYYY